MCKFPLSASVINMFVAFLKSLFDKQAMALSLASSCFVETSLGKIGVMKQSDAIQFLYRDLQLSKTHLVLEGYDQVFEEEMQEYFPFTENTMTWLIKLYQSEKYGAFDEKALSLYFEKEHPFLFIRDMAHMNSWNVGHRRADRRDHITGMMFSSNTTFALEATLCLCRPSLISESQGQWFDFKQAMTNLELTPQHSLDAQAWKACALFYLYFYLSTEGHDINRDELLELIDPYMETIEVALYEGCEELRKECGQVTRMLRQSTSQTLLDGISV